MALSHAASGEVVSVRPFGEQLGDHTTSAILKAQQMEIMRVVLPAGREMREHSAPGELTVQCLEGHFELRTPQATHVLRAGDLVHLQRMEPHALKAIDNSSVLVTVCLVH